MRHIITYCNFLVDNQPVVSTMSAIVQPDLGLPRFGLDLFSATGGAC